MVPGALQEPGHGFGSRAAFAVAGATRWCEALLSGADLGWGLRSTGHLKLCYKIIHSKGKLCYCINTTDNYFP